MAEAVAVPRAAARRGHATLVEVGHDHRYRVTPRDALDDLLDDGRVLVGHLSEHLAVVLVVDPAVAPRRAAVRLPGERGAGHAPADVHRLDLGLVRGVSAGV